MKKFNFKNKSLFLWLGGVILVSICLMIVVTLALKSKVSLSSQTIAVRSVSSEIQANGIITSQNEAVLHFQTGGKLTYLPFKEGAKISAGQTVASLDTYALQRELTAALNNYKTQRDTFDQTQQNSQTGVLQGQEQYGLDVTNKVGLGQNEQNVINDMAKRILDQNQASLDNSVISVELANYALDLSTLTSPISGIVTHEDVSVSNVNVTPQTTFIVDDPSSMVFRAQVSDGDIDFVSEGGLAQVRLNGQDKIYDGEVVQIHPEKITLSNGSQGYNVDLVVSSLPSNVALGQSGFVEIQSNTALSTKLIPRWVLLNGNQVWVLENGKAFLKTVVAGKIHGDDIEIESGFSGDDRIISDPRSIISSKYQIL